MPVGFGYLPDDLAGNARGNDSRRDISLDDTARADDRIVSYRRARQDRRARAYPNIIAHRYGLGDLDALFAHLRIERMLGGGEQAVRRNNS